MRDIKTAKEFFNFVKEDVYKNNEEQRKLILERANITELLELSKRLDIEKRDSVYIQFNQSTDDYINDLIVKKEELNELYLKKIDSIKNFVSLIEKKESIYASYEEGNIYIEINFKYLVKEDDSTFKNRIIDETLKKYNYLYVDYRKVLGDVDISIIKNDKLNTEEYLFLFTYNKTLFCFSCDVKELPERTKERLLNKEITERVSELISYNKKLKLKFIIDIEIGKTHDQSFIETLFSLNNNLMTLKHPDEYKI